MGWRGWIADGVCWVWVGMCDESCETRKSWCGVESGEWSVDCGVVVARTMGTSTSVPRNSKTSKLITNISTYIPLPANYLWPEMARNGQETQSLEV
jgi:hypothetical protein